jgi:hypothetical protein
MSQPTRSAVESLAAQLSPSDQLMLVSTITSGLSGKFTEKTDLETNDVAVTWESVGGIAPGLTGMDAQEWVDKLRNGWQERLDNIVDEMK